MHLEELQLNVARCQRNETILWQVHAAKFAQWVKEKVLCSVVFNIAVYTLICLDTNQFPLTTDPSQL